MLNLYNYGLLAYHELQQEDLLQGTDIIIYNTQRNN